MKAKTKRSFPFDEDFVHPYCLSNNQVKKFKVHNNQMPNNINNMSTRNFVKHSKVQSSETLKRTSLAEKMRPTNIAAYVGQKQIIGPGTILSHLLERGEIPSMIFWGPHGCGKVKKLILLLIFM